MRFDKKNNQRSPQRRRSLGMLAATTVALFTIGLSAPSQAQDPEEGVRYTRNSKKTKAKSGLIKTKFEEAKKEEAKRQSRRVDMMAGADFAKHREAVAQEMSDKQIEFLKRLIKSTDKSDAEYPDLLFRLSDHYLEKKAYFETQAGSLYDQIYAAEDAGNKSKQKQLEAKQNEFRKKAKEASGQAARIYQALVNDSAFAGYKRMDEALYYYAFELGNLGKESEMQLAYQQLINNYPDSRFISQAYLADRKSVV